jgi:hypothetical protein
MFKPFPALGFVSGVTAGLFILTAKTYFGGDKCEALR